MADQDGLTIVFSPVQLAALLDGVTLGAHERSIARLWGGAGLIFSALQLVGGVGLLLTPEPTMVTKVGGGLLVGHGLDSGQAAARQLWSGVPTEDLTQQAGESLATHLGGSHRIAFLTGIGLDVAVPLAVSAGLGAERILAMRAGRFSLAAEEAAGGHTIAKHVGQSEAAMRARLAAEKGTKRVSSFTSLKIAENVISDALQANKQQIMAWAKSALQGETYDFVYVANKPLGAGIIKSTGSLQSSNVAVIVVKKAQIGSRVYFLLTAYPKL